jgi:superfamily I DNA/RNA helicase
MFRAARSLLLEQPNTTSGFKHIIVDEIQDLHPQAFRLLRAMLPEDEFQKNDLFLVGDGHQSLYGHHIVLSQLGINIRGRGRRLKLNYRTPEQTRKWASSILQNVTINNLDGELDSTKGYRSIISGPEPIFKSCNSFPEEMATIKAWIKDIKLNQENQVICVTLRNKKAIDKYAQALEESGISTYKITADNHDTEDPTPIRLVTMHRIKGLEFDHVCIADCSKNAWNSYQNAPDRMNSEKCLLHVAATRTKNSLLVTATGQVFEH